MQFIFTEKEVDLRSFFMSQTSEKIGTHINFSCQNFSVECICLYDVGENKRFISSFSTSCRKNIFPYHDGSDNGVKNW